MPSSAVVSAASQTYIHFHWMAGWNVFSVRGENRRRFDVAFKHHLRNSTTWKYAWKLFCSTTICDVCLSEKTWFVFFLEIASMDRKPYYSVSRFRGTLELVVFCRERTPQKFFRGPKRAVAIHCAYSFLFLLRINCVTLEQNHVDKYFIESAF